MSQNPNYPLLAQQIAELCQGEVNLVGNLANVSALINDTLHNINWVGFYFLQTEDGTAELILGPFQGHPACQHIAVGKGVCGQAVQTDTPQLVADVHTFAGHIACDSASRSELVIPLHVNQAIVGVLDIDSPLLARFDQADLEGLLLCTEVLEAMWAACIDAR